MNAEEDGQSFWFDDASERALDKVAYLIATVKTAQVRLLGAPYGGTQTLVYDNLISFLESGELPPEWQP